MLINIFAFTFSLLAAPTLVRVDALDVTKDAGMTVTIVGPPALIARLDDCRNDRGTRIDWGDGTSYKAPGKDCRKVRAHTYRVTGHYRIKASVASEGPSGQPIVDWESDAEFVAK